MRYISYYDIIRCTIFDSINEFKVGLLYLLKIYIFFLNKKKYVFFSYFCLKTFQSECLIPVAPKKDVNIFIMNIIIFPRTPLQDVPYTSFLFIKNAHFRKNFCNNEVYIKKRRQLAYNVNVLFRFLYITYLTPFLCSVRK